MVSFLVALADANVPVQANGVPPGLLKKLQPGKISGFLSLGNIGPCVVKVLKRIQADMRLVAGDSEQEAHLPTTQVVEVEGVRIGMVHGHLVMPRGDQYALDAVRRWLDVDVLVSAATGRASTRQVGSALLVDPGSITGIRCSHLASGQPSFSLLSVDAGKVTTFTYTQQSDGSVSFQRHDFKRKSTGAVHAPVPASTNVLKGPTFGTPVVPGVCTSAVDGAAANNLIASSTTNGAKSTAQHTTVSAPTAPQKTDKPNSNMEDEKESATQIVTEELKDVEGQANGLGSGAPAVLRDASGEGS